jgi:hypothetical protein
MASSLCAGFYHLAGKGDFKNAKLLRRFVVPLIALGYIISLIGFKLANLPYFLLFIGLNYMAMSTYHDYLAPDGSSENWVCWLMTGFCYGISAFPICIITGYWIGFAIRTVILTLGIMLIRENTNSVFIEEFGSGFIYGGTIPLLLI